ncbi:hypothetical protein B0H13DRAFT_1606061 [Mycena leptocephala]|nr:hypothetical protein B0H13DRAFT_1606061 [Mycena leptocephala]
MRRWWKTNFIHDLITHLENIENPAPEDVDSLQLLKSYLKGDHIVFSKFPKPITLRDLPGYYGLIHRYLSTLWCDKMILYSDVSGSVPMGGAIFNGVVLSFSHILVNGCQFGAMTRPRGRSAQYGYIEDRIPVQIQYILRAIQPRSSFADCVADFAVVRRFQMDQNMLEFPWMLRFDID